MKRIIVGLLAITVGFLLATNPVVGNAAGQITGHQIKNNSITGKDVRESSLKVVPQATDAQSLAGIPAASYLNQTYRFRLPVSTPALSRSFSFPGVPAGNYLVTYQTAILASASVFCVLGADNVTFLPGEAVSFSTTSGSSFVNSGSTVITVASGKTAGLRCTSGSNFTVYGGTDAQSSVTFTRIDSLVDLGNSGVTRPAESSNGFAR
jgi:hypothetical protein